MARVRNGLRQPYRRHKSERDLEVEQERQIKARGTGESNVDSEDMEYRKEILNAIIAEQRR